MYVVFIIIIIIIIIIILCKNFIYETSTFQVVPYQPVYSSVKITQLLYVLNDNPEYIFIKENKKIKILDAPPLPPQTATKLF